MWCIVFSALSQLSFVFEVGYSDYFRYPGVKYFESLPDLWLTSTQALSCGHFASLPIKFRGYKEIGEGDPAGGQNWKSTTYNSFIFLFYAPS